MTCCTHPCEFSEQRGSYDSQPRTQGSDANSHAPGSAASSGPQRADAEVVAHARRRQFSNADKRRTLTAADRCTQPGEIGALMRREGVYSSSPSTWRRQREAADLAALAPQKRDPKRNWPSTARPG